MRCQECNKFVSFDDDADVSEVEAELDGDGADAVLHVTGIVRLRCAECGNDMAEGELDEEFPIIDIVPDFGDIETVEGCDLELGDFECSYAETIVTTTKAGRPIKNPRYMKTLKGATVAFKVKKTTPSEKTSEHDGECECLIPASSFEDIQ